MDICDICGSMPKQGGPEFIHDQEHTLCPECYETDYHITWNKPQHNIDPRTQNAMFHMIRAAINAIKTGKLKTHKDRTP